MDNLSFNSEERSDGSVQDPDTFNKLLIRQIISAVFNVQFCRENRCDDLEVNVRLVLANLTNRINPIRQPVGKHIVEEVFAEFVACAFRPPLRIT